jgi:CRP/FNR family transcriptional regulator, cyclic AMP receptor protein
MNDKVGIWIDHKKAVIVSTSGDRVTAKTLESEVGPHARYFDLEEDLCDQLFNHSEKRLARVLLKLARLREHDVAADASIPVLSHETLAEMVGTTRSRITHFMNKFRRMGLIDYNGTLTVRTEMLTDLVLHD